MPRAMQKTLLKLGVIGFVSLVVFNYPLLSLYRGSMGEWPLLYVWLFVWWLAVILIARRITEPSSGGLLKSNVDRGTP